MRLYLRFYLTVLAALAALALTTLWFWHDGRVPSEGISLHGTLVWLVVTIGAAAYPVVRHLTGRLERLQRGVESLGRGNLSARVPVQGADEVAQLARSFNAAAATIEQLMQAHKQLLANASHELRTPLARLQLALSLIEVSDARRDQIERDIAELDGLVDEILLASRLDTAADALRPEALDLLAMAVEAGAEHDGVVVLGQPCMVRGDVRLLRRLLRNLIDNALKHGQAPVEVRVRAVASGAELVVSDAAPGVTPAEFDAVFTPFYRSPSTRPGTGTGLGLALVRQIAQRHGGEALCTAKAGGGSEFVVRLPG